MSIGSLCVSHRTNSAFTELRVLRYVNPVSDNYPFGRHKRQITSKCAGASRHTPSSHTFVSVTLFFSLDTHNKLPGTQPRARRRSIIIPTDQWATLRQASRSRTSCLRSSWAKIRSQARRWLSTRLSPWPTRCRQIRWLRPVQPQHQLQQSGNSLVFCGVCWCYSLIPDYFPPCKPRAPALRLILDYFQTYFLDGRADDGRCKQRWPPPWR